MSKLDNKILMCNLYEIYKSQLTSKQAIVFEQYYYDDLSINEISEISGVTKNAVFNSLKKTEKRLIELEKNLHIYYNYEYNIELLEANLIDEAIVNLLK